MLSCSIVAPLAGECQGLLLEQLAVVAEHCDKDCVNFFRHGAPLLGELPCSGIGLPLSELAAPAAIHPERGVLAYNSTLLTTLHEDPHADAMMQSVRDDARAGRMTEPELACDTDLSEVRNTCVCFARGKYYMRVCG